MIRLGPVKEALIESEFPHSTRKCGPKSNNLAMIDDNMIPTPIEKAFSKLKALLRKRKASTYDALWQAVGHICDLFTPRACWNDFKAAQCVAE